MSTPIISVNPLIFHPMEIVTTVENPKLSSHKTENDKSRNIEKLTNPLKIFFDFMYYSCLFPTRFITNPGTKLFYGKQWLPQKVMCAVLNILNCYQYTCLIRLALPKNLSDFQGNPLMYFIFFHRATSIIYKYIVMKRFWFDWNSYLDILNYILKSNKPCLKSTKFITSKLFWYSFQGIIIVSIFYNVVVGDRSPLISIDIHQWSPKTWLENLVRYARFTFNFEKHCHDLPDLQQLSAWDWIICVTLLFSDIRGKILIMFSDIGILAAAITLKTASSEFASLVRNTALDEETLEQNQFDERESWKIIYGNFQAIQNLSSKINLAFGTIVSIYLVEGLLYYSGKLGLVIFLDWEKYHRLDLFILSMLFIAVLKTSADIGSQISAIKTWLTKSTHRKSAPFDEVNLVLHDLATNDIGIKGSDMFTITYGFLGGFSSLILTLFIISAQHKE